MSFGRRGCGGADIGTISIMGEFSLQQLPQLEVMCSALYTSQVGGGLVDWWLVCKAVLNGKG